MKRVSVLVASLVLFRYRVKLIVLAIVAFLGTIAGEGLIRRVISISFCGLLGLNSLCTANWSDGTSAKAASSATVNQTEISEGITQEQKVSNLCIFGVCAPVKLPTPVESVIQGEIDKGVQKQLRALLADQIPISGSDHKFYPSVSELPGKAFVPQVLYLTDLSPKTPISSGDYEIPVHFYCTGVYSFNGHGNRFALAQLNGRMAEALSALYARTSYDSSAPINEIQTLAWAMQSGMAYNELADPQKALVDKYIPEYRESMKRSFIDRLTGISGDVSRISGGRIPNITQVLDKLGPVGDVAQSLLRAREQMLRTNYSHQPLAQEFSPQKDFFLEGGVEKTPWSQIQSNMYMRFIAPSGAMHDGKVQVRILKNVSHTAVGNYQVAQTLPLLATPASTETTSEVLLSHVVKSVGISEGSGGQATQPKAARKCPIFQENRTNSPSKPQIIYLNFQGNNDIKFYCSRNPSTPHQNCPKEGFITLETTFDIFDIYDPAGSDARQDRDKCRSNPQCVQGLQRNYMNPIIQILQQTYKGFNVQFTTQRPVEMPYSTVNIVPDADKKNARRIYNSLGVANQELENASRKIEGLAESVDCSNSNRDDNAIVFASRRDGKGSIIPATEIALTVAHEIGHLLGLSHNEESSDGNVGLSSSLMREGGCDGQMPCELSPESKKILEMNVGLKR